MRTEFKNRYCVVDLDNTRDGKKQKPKLHYRIKKTLGEKEVATENQKILGGVEKSRKIEEQ